MICPNCSIELLESDIMCSNCGEIFEENVGVDFDNNAKFIETVDEEDLVDIGMSFDDEDFEEYESPNEIPYEVNSLFEKPSDNENEETQEKLGNEVVADTEYYQEFESVEELIERENLAENEANKEEILAEEKTQINKPVSKEDSEKVYLKQNFYSMEKVAELVSGDIIEKRKKSTTYDENGQIVEKIEELEDGADNLEEEVEVSSKELVKKIGESAETHQAHIEKEEREKAEEVARHYRKYRVTLLVLIKRLLIFFAIIANGLMIYDLTTNNFVKLSSQMYTNYMVENYDKVTWENIDYIIQLDKVLVEGVAAYNNKQISAEDLENIALNHIREISGRNEMFSMSVYSEAEQYIFVASKLAFTSQYLCENILDFFETGDKIYEENYKKATEKLSEFFEEVAYERVEFLREVGFSEEEINIMVNFGE